MSAIKKLAGQTAIYGLPSILGRFLNYLLVPLYTGLLDPSEYGVVSIFYANVAFFLVFLTMGMETTFFRFVVQSEDKERTFNQAFSVVLVVNSTFLIIGLFFSGDMASLMGYPDYSKFVLWFCIILVMDSTSSLYMAKIRYQQQGVKFAVIQFSSIGVNILLNLVFMLLLLPHYPDFGIGFIFLANLISAFVKPILLFSDFRNFRFRFDRQEVQSMLKYGLPIMVAGFAGIINEVLDRNLILYIQRPLGQEYAEAEVGIYSACYKLSLLITLFLQAYRYAAEPFFFGAEKEKNRDKLYAQVMTWFIIVVSLIFLVVSINLEIFKWFIPNQTYWGGLKIVPILMMANVFLGIYYNQSIWYKLSNRTGYGSLIAWIGAAVTIGLNFILIPILGYLGAAWTTLFTYGIMMVISYFLGQKFYPIHYNLRKAALYLSSSTLLFFIAKWIGLDFSWLYVLVNLILVGLFVGLVFFIERPLVQFRKG